MSDYEENNMIESTFDDANAPSSEIDEKTDQVDEKNGDDEDTDNEVAVEYEQSEEQKQQIVKSEAIANEEMNGGGQQMQCHEESKQAESESHQEQQVSDQDQEVTQIKEESAKKGSDAVIETFQDPSELFPEESIQAVKESCERARQLLSESKNPVVHEALGQTLNGALASKHDDDERKIFVGGLHWETTISDLREYFSQYGKVVDCTLKTDPTTGRSRGFGFVLFESLDSVNKVCDEKSHVLQGKTIDPKRAVSKSSVAGGGGSKDPIKKIFVGGVSPDMSEGDIRSFFVKYGQIDEVELPFDRLKNQRRAYVFITYNHETCAEEACKQSKQKLGERDVDVRRATPRSESEHNRGGGRGGGRGRGREGNYDYSAYYGYPGYPNYPAYQQMPTGYDYSSYYSNDWSQYGQQYAQQYGYQMGQAAANPAAPAAVPPVAAAPAPNAYAAYDYNSWYNQQDAANKLKRGGAAPAYHPYTR